MVYKLFFFPPISSHIESMLNPLKTFYYLFSKILETYSAKTVGFL